MRDGGSHHHDILRSRLKYHTTEAGAAVDTSSTASPPMTNCALATDKWQQQESAPTQPSHSWRGYGVCRHRSRATPPCDTPATAAESHAQWATAIQRVLTRGSGECRRRRTPG